LKFFKIPSVFKGIRTEHYSSGGDPQFGEGAPSVSGADPQFGEGAPSVSIKIHNLFQRGFTNCKISVDFKIKEWALPGSVPASTTCYGNKITVNTCKYYRPFQKKSL
jgi:hypothetical protein